MYLWSKSQTPAVEELRYVIKKQELEMKGLHQQLDVRKYVNLNLQFDKFFEVATVFSSNSND